MTYGDGTDNRVETASVTVGNSSPILSGCVDRNAVPVAFEGNVQDVMATSDASFSRLTCTASDPDGDALSWRAFGCMERYEMNASGQVRLKSGGTAASEDCHLHIVVSDGTASATNWIEIDVTVPNGPGFATLGTTLAGWAGSMLRVPGSDSYLVGGDFTTVGDYQSINRATRLKSNGTLDNTGWQLPRNDSVHAISRLPDGSLLFGGRFTEASTAGSTNNTAATTPRIMHVLSGGALGTGAGELHNSANMGTGSNTGFNDEVEDIDHNAEAIPDDLRIFVAGDFSELRMANGGTTEVITTPGVACFTGTWAECAVGWRVPTNGTEDFNVNAVAYGENAAGTEKYVFAGGRFTTLNGTPRAGLVRLNAATGIPDDSGLFSIGSGFTESGGGNNIEIRDIVVDKAREKIYVAGRFQRYNGIAVEGLVRLNWNGTLDTTFMAGGASQSLLRGEVWKVKLWNDPSEPAASPKVYAAGFFDDVHFAGEGSQRAFAGLARMNTDGSRDQGFCPGGAHAGAACDFTGSSYRYFDMRDFAIRSDGSLVAVGNFDRYGSTVETPDGVILLSQSGAADAQFITDAGSGFNRSWGGPGAIALTDDDTWIVGGNLNTYKGILSRNIALWDASANAGAGGWDASFSASNRFNETINQLAYDPEDPGRYYVGGYYCGGTYAGVGFSDWDNSCGLLRFQFADHSRDVSFTAPRSVFFDPQRIAFIPDDPAFGDAAGDIVTVGTWNAFEWSNSTNPLVDFNGGDPGFAYSQFLARLNGTEGTFDLDFDTGFVPVLCSDDGNAANETCPQRNRDIGLSHSAGRVAVDPLTGITYVSSISNGGSTATYKGSSFTEKVLRIDTEGNRVAP